MAPPSDPKRALSAFKGFTSTAISAGCVFIILYGLSNGHAALEGNPAVLFALLVSDLTLLAYLEGLQVAILALERIHISAYADRYPRAMQVHKYATRGNNVQRFLVGRQAFVIFTVFLMAQLTTYPTLPTLGLPHWLFVGVIETGLPGALVVLAFGQLMPQLLAAHAPVWFLNLRGASHVVSIALAVEASGLTHFSWILTHAAKKAFTLRHEDHDPHSKANQGSEMERMLGTERTTWDEDMTVAADDALLQQYAAEGLADAASAPDARDSVQRTLERHESDVEAGRRTGVDDWGFTPDGYPMPQDLVRRLLAERSPVPRFLLPPRHELHVPPHIVAYQLMEALNAAREAGGDPESGLLRRSGSSAFVNEFFADLEIEEAALRKAQEYRAEYRSWRVGKAQGAKGEVRQSFDEAESSL